MWNPHLKKKSTIWFNIAIENGIFIVDLPIQNGDFQVRFLC